MDLTIYENAIKKTLDVVNFDDNAIMKRANDQIRAFLNDNTSITDDQKASVYSEFLSSTTTAVVTEAVRAAMELALQGPVNDANIIKIQTETAIAQAQSDKDLAVKDSDIAVNSQKIESMKADDIAKKNEVAAKVAKAKIEIEQLIPSQVALNEKDIAVKDKELALRDKQITVEENRAQLMAKQVEIEGEKIPLMQAQVSVEQAKIPLMEAQAQVESQKVSLMEQQTEVEAKKVVVMEKDALIKEKQVDVEAKRVAVMEAQVGV
jgi:hypothetical protein